VVPPEGGAGTESERELYRRAYRCMVRSRTLDETMASLYRGGKIVGGVFLGRGQEALSVALGIALRPGDVFAPLIRDGAGRLAFGEPMVDRARNYLGSALGPMRGRDGNVHHGRPRENLLAMISHLGAMISVVNGVLMARRMQGQQDLVGATCVGEGASSTGACHEALNQAAVERLPLVLVVADNQYAYSTPNTRQFACRSLADRAVGYGIAGHEVDGTDLAACMAVIGQAVRLARQGQSPQLVVGRLLRLCGHGEHDDASYIDPLLKRSAIGRDCLKLAAALLVQRGFAAPSELESWQTDATHEVDEIVAQVQLEPRPDPYRETWCAMQTTALAEGLRHPPAGT
jgi:pyruvate dehydrogenase E1 component alpha subunit/2-oxoisovalerate dehydrogenase E1 component alpha subunit